MKKLLYIFLLGLCFSLTAEAQKLPFRTYSINKGLSESVVNALEQDEKGYLWIGTSYGLNRFDGIRFKNYYTEQGLGNNEIHTLYEDHKGRIWIGTAGGVNVIQSDSIYAIPQLEVLKTSTVKSIYQDHLNEFWFATDGQGAWHLDRDKKVTQYRTVNGLGGDRVQDITEDEQNVLWFATLSGLTKLEDGNFRTYTMEDGLPDNRLRDLLVAADGTLWAATRGGLCRMKDGSFSCYTEEDGLVNNHVQSLFEGAPGELWIGTEEGVSLFKDGSFTNYTTREGLTSNIVQTTLYDREGNVWFGTLGGGLSLFLGDYFRSYTTEEGLPNNSVTGIEQGPSGNHWISTYGGGLAELTGDQFSVFDTDDGLADNKVYTLHTAQNGELFIGTRNGLSIYNDGQFYGFEGSALSSSRILSIYQQEARGNWWLGTYGDGVFEYDGGSLWQLTQQDGLAGDIVIAIEQADDGAYWFATYGGVSRLKDSTFTNYTIQDGLPNNGVLDILKDKSGDMWFATFGGLAHYKDGSIQAITAEDGLPDEVCYFIEQDDRGIFWIGTNKGLVRFDYAAFRLAEQSGEARAFKLLTEDQGLAGNEMNTGASFKDRSGNLWFGSMEGLTQLIPSADMVNKVAPGIHIESINVSGEEIPIQQDLEIAGSNRNITVSFIGINFTAPRQVEYKYRLKNSGEGWQTTTQREVRYSALIPGEYTFEVMAQNSDGRWSKQNARFSFKVLAPFWLRWWFIGLVLVALLGIVLLFYNYYRVKKMVDIERMRVRIASDLHDDVGSTLTEIALQSDFLQTMDVADSLEESLQQIGEQSRKIVSSLDDIVWSIDARNDTVGDLTDRMQDYANSVLPDKKVRYNFKGNMQERLKVSLKENVYLIFKEAVNNIAKHSNADEVDITLAANGSRFSMSIKDNGTSGGSGRKTGQGLRNMKMRAKRIDADITFTNSEGFEVRVSNER